MAVITWRPMTTHTDAEHVAVLGAMKVQINPMNGEVLNILEEHDEDDYVLDFAEVQRSCIKAGHAIPAQLWWLRRMRLPYGMPSDGASIPSIAHGWANPFGESLIAALFHDPLYQLGVKPNGRRVSRAEADEVFYYLCIADGMRPSKAWAKWFGLYLGGWVAWNRCRKENGQ